MSRIGNKIIVLPEGVSLTVNGNTCNVKGPKGSLDVIINDGITVTINGNEVVCTRANDEKQIKQNHGTTRANINNAVIGVSVGYKKVLEMKGIGFKAAMVGQNVQLWAGYSHTVTITPKPGVKISLPSATDIVVEGINKEYVGETAAQIRAVRKPEPYLGKGIRYKGEVIILKEGKRASGGKK